MTKSFFQLLIYTCLILTYCNCQEKKTSYDPQAIRLNNKAVEFIKAQSFDSALIYLDKAIEIDTTYYAAYGNKCSVYCSLKDYKNALLATQKEIEVKPDLAEARTFGGMLYDRLGDTLMALVYYKKSVELFDQRIMNSEKKIFRG
jgi:tetratricopeptide (TPR) repeat protein